MECFGKILLLAGLAIVRLRLAQGNDEIKEGRVLLDSGWKVCADHVGCFNARVPGSALLDAQAGKDPYEGFAESEWSELSLMNWTYSLRKSDIDWTGAEEAQLYFEGIDTVATVSCNGGHALKSTRERRQCGTPG